jgi:hypothetical protein
MRLFGLLLLLLLPVAALAQIPSDVKSFFNTADFIAVLADHCNVDLNVYGKKGASRESCRDFIDAFKPFLASIDAESANLAAAYKAVEGPTHGDFDILIAEYERNVDRMIKTSEHLRFLVGRKTDKGSASR